MAEKQLSKRNALCVFNTWPIDQGSGGDADDIIRSTFGSRGLKSKQKCQQDVKSDLGFTFVIIENASDNTYYDLEIQYKDSYSATKQYN